MNVDMRGVINPDDVVSAVLARMRADEFLRATVNSFDKGPKRRDNFVNPAMTVHLLTASIDGETDALHGTVVINTYVDDTATGRAHHDLIGKLNERVVFLMRRAHLRSHAAGALAHPNLLFKQVHVGQALILPSDHKGEHVGSVDVRVTVKRR